MGEDIPQVCKACERSISTIQFEKFDNLCAKCFSLVQSGKKIEDIVKFGTTIAKTSYILLAIAVLLYGISPIPILLAPLGYSSVMERITSIIIIIGILSHGTSLIFASVIRKKKPSPFRLNIFIIISALIVIVIITKPSIIF
jgi:predicted membrane channel-forming protein YqfA (hemolysin III family)